MFCLPRGPPPDGDGGPAAWACIAARLSDVTGHHSEETTTDIDRISRFRARLLRARIKTGAEWFTSAVTVVGAVMTCCKWGRLSMDKDGRLKPTSTLLGGTVQGCDLILALMLICRLIKAYILTCTLDPASKIAREIPLNQFQRVDSIQICG